MSKLPKISLPNARRCVQNKQPFNCNDTLYAEWVDDRIYVVYSYYFHHPLFVYAPHDDKWYANPDKVSMSTSRHYTKAHPHCECVELSTTEMRQLVAVERAAHKEQA